MNKRALMLITLMTAFAVAWHAMPAKTAPAAGSRKAGHKPVSVKKAKKQLTEDQAIDAVSKLPEVKKWTKQLTSTKGAGNPGYMATKDGSTWTVQVFESKPDHNVTFGFYDVDANTGTVKKEGY